MSADGSITHLGDSTRAGARAGARGGVRGARPLRVLMTADAVGGVWNHALELCARLVGHGVEPLLAVMGPHFGARHRRDAERSGVPVVHGDYRLEWMDDPWRDVDRAGRWLLELEREHCADIVHSNGFAHAALPFKSPVLVVAHSSVGSWWRAVLGQGAPSQYSEYSKRLRAGIAAASRLVAPTRAMLDALFQHDLEGAPPGQLRSSVIYNGVSRLEVQSAADGGEPSKHDFVLCAGRFWDKAKNLELLAAAAPRLSWPILVAGSRHPRGPIAELAQLSAPGLTCLGELPPYELANYMQRASIYAAPALYEPFGLAIAEAARTGAALVLGDIPSLRELWDGAARFVNPRSLAEFCAAVEGLIADPSERARLGREARRRASLYTSERMAASYHELYCLLSANGARVRPAQERAS